MSVRLPTKEEKIHQKEGVEEKNHHQEKEGVEMIVMNEEHPGEARIWKGWTSHQGATQNEDIKLMLEICPRGNNKLVIIIIFHCS